MPYTITSILKKTYTSNSPRKNRQESFEPWLFSYFWRYPLKQLYIYTSKKHQAALNNKQTQPSQVE